MRLTSINLTGKELQGKEQAHYLESKVGHVSGLKNHFMKTHILSVYVLQSQRSSQFDIVRNHCAKG